MKKYLIIASSIFLFACSNNSIEEQPQTELNPEINSSETNTEYELIRDNLYSDHDGNLYLKSRTKEHFETGKWIDVWIKTVYCDSCWTPTENGWTDITELKDFVDVKSFHLAATDNEQGGDFYEDLNNTYFHKWMADGGTITLTKK